MTASRAEREGSAGRVEPVRIGDAVVKPGRTARVEIPVARLPTGTWLSLPVAAVVGSEPGPSIWLNAAVHGDEINGVEIIRRVLGALDAKRLRGSVLAVPIVNVFGFVNESRYLPDRRDLNRAFPGSSRGSLAARLAHLFIEQVVSRCSLGIDLHTGSDDRSNLPQIRADLDDPDVRRAAEAFGAPVMIHSRMRDGSLREAATQRGAHVLVYEGGQALRFDEPAIEAGVRGVLNVMASLGMRDNGPTSGECIEARRTTWVRARRGGIFRSAIALGDRVKRAQVIGVIADSLGEDEILVRAPIDGLVIGLSLNPLTSQGEGIVHIAEVPPG